MCRTLLGRMILHPGQYIIKRMGGRYDMVDFIEHYAFCPLTHRRIRILRSRFLQTVKSLQKEREPVIKVRKF